MSQWKTIFRPESSEIKDLKDEPLYSRFRAYKIAHKYFFILTIIPVAFIMYYIGFYETNPLNLEDSYYIIRIAIISFFLFMLLSVSLITGVRALKLKKDIGVKKRVISIPLIIIWIILFVFFYLNAAAYFA